MLQQLEAQVKKYRDRLSTTTKDKDELIYELNEKLKTSAAKVRKFWLFLE